MPSNSYFRLKDIKWIIGRVWGLEGCLRGIDIFTVGRKKNARKREIMSGFRSGFSEHLFFENGPYCNNVHQILCFHLHNTPHSRTSESLTVNQEGSSFLSPIFFITFYAIHFNSPLSQQSCLTEICPHMPHLLNKGIFMIPS